MIETTFPNGPCSTVAWFGGVLHVAHHDDATHWLHVVRCSLDLQGHFPVVPPIAVAGGSAAVRLQASRSGVPFVIYRVYIDPSHDSAHWMNLQTGVVRDLPAFWSSAEPFAVGIGRVAYQIAVNRVAWFDLDTGKGDEQVIPDAPTGLSHIGADGRVWTEGEMVSGPLGTVVPWGIGWAVDGAAEVACGRKTGIAGHIVGKTGFISLWHGREVFGPQVAVNGAEIAVSGWAPVGDIPVAVVTAADLVPRLPVDPVTPSTPAPPPSSIQPVRRQVWVSYWKQYEEAPPDTSLPINLAMATDAFTLAVALSQLHPLLITDNLITFARQHWARVAAIMVHEEGSDAKIKQRAVFALATMDRLRLPRRPIATYTGVTSRVGLFGVDYAGVQAYGTNDWAVQDAPGLMRAHLKAERLKHGTGRLWMHGRAYDQRSFNDQTRRPATVAEGWCDLEALKAIQCVFAAELKQPSWAGLSYFAAGQRQGGIHDYPELLPYHRAIRAAVLDPVVPVEPPPPPPPPPDPPPPPPPPGPVDPPDPPGGNVSNHGPRNETVDFMLGPLNAHYRDELHVSPERFTDLRFVGEVAGFDGKVYVDIEGLVVWQDVYLAHRDAGKSYQEARDATMAELSGNPR